MLSLNQRFVAVAFCPYPLTFVGLSALLPSSVQIHWMTVPLLLFGVAGYVARSTRKEQLRRWKNWIMAAIGVCLFMAIFQARIGDFISGWLLMVLAIVLSLEGLRDMDYALLRGRFND